MGLLEPQGFGRNGRDWRKGHEGFVERAVSGRHHEVTPGWWESGSNVSADWQTKFEESTAFKEANLEKHIFKIGPSLQWRGAFRADAQVTTYIPDHFFFSSYLMIFMSSIQHFARARFQRFVSCFFSRYFTVLGFTSELVSLLFSSNF